METIKISIEKKEELINKLSEIDFKNFSESIKAQDKDSGTFEVIISTENVDRHGEIIKLDAWDIEHYMKNPVVLWGHNYSILPIGVCTSIEFIDGKMIAKGKFASADANPMAQQVRKLYDLGVIRTTSVGFIAKKFEGNMITEAELLEFSFVSVPANPYALSTLIQNEISLDEMVQKGFLDFKVKDNDTEEEKKEEDKEKETEKTEEKSEEKQEEDDKQEDIIENETTKIQKLQILNDIKTSITALEDLYKRDLEGQGDDELDEEEEKALEFTQKKLILQKASGVLAEVLGEVRKAKNINNK